MQYELTKLDSFIESIHTQDIQQPFTSTTTGEGGATAFLISEKENIKQAIINTVFSLEDERVAQLYIRNHQNALVILANKLNVYNGEAKQLQAVLFEHASQTAEELLSFIEKYFHRYYDLDCIVPDRYYHLIKAELKLNLKRLKKIEALEQGQKLYALIQELFYYKVNMQHNTITYRKAFYLRELWEIILKNSSHLEEQLLYLNFNAPQFYKYLSDKISTALNNADSVQERIRILQFEIKRLKQLNTKPGCIYRTDCPNITTWLIDWLKEELYYQEKAQPVVSMPAILPNDISNKMETNLSVGQLALFTRLCVDAGIIKPANITRLLKIIAANFVTKKAGQQNDISWESLQSKYYHTEGAAKEIVKDILIKMMNEVRKK